MRCENLQDHWETIRDEIPDLGDDWVSCFNPGFLKYPLILDEKYISKNCIRCPKTCEILTKITEDMAYNVGYSLIRAHSKLSIHTDTENLGVGYLYTINLCLKCPEKCKLHHMILGTVNHQDGVLIKYDANELHGVENNSDEDRYIFYVEVYSKSEP